MKIDRTELEKMYLHDHMTMAEIGKVLGCSRQNVHQHIMRLGISTENAESFMAKCDQCGREYRVNRRRFLSQEHHFCRKACYTDFQHTDAWRREREGRHVGRIVLEQHLGRRLRDGERVRHKDGNPQNNAVANLGIVLT